MGTASLCLTPAQATPAFSWTRSFEFIFSFLPFLEKEKKNIWCFLELFDLHSIRSEGRICVQNAVKLPWKDDDDDDDYYYYLVFFFINL